MRRQLLPSDTRPNIRGVRHAEDLPAFRDPIEVVRSILAVAGGVLTRRRPVKEYWARGNTVGTTASQDRTFHRQITGGRGRFDQRVGSNRQAGLPGMPPFVPPLSDGHLRQPTARGQLLGAPPTRTGAEVFAFYQRLPRTFQQGYFRGDQQRFQGLMSTRDRSRIDDDLNIGPIPMKVTFPLSRAVTALAAPGDVSGYGSWAAPMPGTRSGTLVLRPVDVYYGRARGVGAIRGVLATGVEGNELSHVPAVFVPSQVG
jgi:hypothetical protein